MKIAKNNLRILLAKNDMKQKDFAEKTGLSERTVSDAVNQKITRYPITLINAMIQEFNLNDMNEVFRIEED